MGRLMSKVPHKIYINGQLVGIMQTPEVRVQMPAGSYGVRVQSMLQWFSASTMVTVEEGGTSVLKFTDREGWWDILFVIDIVFWIVKRFLHLAAPWTWIYEIFTNGYFVIWLIYEWRICDEYFKLTVS